MCFGVQRLRRDFTTEQFAFLRDWITVCVTPARCCYNVSGGSMKMAWYVCESLLNLFAR